MKKWAKFLSVVLAFVMAFPIFTSCKSEEESSSGSKGPKGVTGQTVGNTYTNEYFDLSLTLPVHWLFEDKKNLTENPYFFFSDLTEQEKKDKGFSFECRAVNEVTADAIEISIEKLDSKYVINGAWNFSNWSTGSGRFNKRPDYVITSGETMSEIAGKEYNGWNYVISNNGTMAGRETIYFRNVDSYVLSISILADGFFGEDASMGKNNAIGRMADWFGTAKSPSTSMNAQGGGYYLNDIMDPHWESDMLYAQYRRNEPFTIAGETYSDCIPLDNGNSSGAGKQKDVVYYLDGKTYKEFSFTVGMMDERILSVTEPSQYVAFEILLDGKQVFEERQYAFAKEQTYKVDITGAKKMVIRVRDNWELTSVVLADPVISVQPRNIDKTITKVTGTVDLLDTLSPYYTTDNAKVFNGKDGKTFNVAGNDYNKGLVLYDTWIVHSHTYFNLGGKYEKFNFSVGVIKESTYANDGWLNIYLDGVKILDVALEYDLPSENYSLDVSGGHILYIEGASGLDYGIYQGDYALYNMTLGAPITEEPKPVEPGSYKLISEIGVPFSTKATRVYDGSTKYRGHYMGDIFYNEGIAMESVYSFIGTPLDSAVPAEANFKLGEQFKYLTFTVGRVDKSHVANDVLVVYGDGKELARYTLDATAFPKAYELNVEGVDVVQFQLLGFAGLTRGTYMVADIGVHTNEVEELEFTKPQQAPFPDTVDLMERFKPYEYMSAEGNGHDAVRYFNGIYDGTDNKKFFTIDGVNHTRGFVLSTCVYLSLDTGGLIGAGSFGIAGFVGGALALLALAASGEVSQASFACFNLQGHYKTMTFHIGVVDNQNYVDNRQQPYDTLYVFADEKSVGTYQLTSDMETMEITVDIQNCERLTFWLDHNRNSCSYGIFDAVVTK
ncbi:MAG: NPCBM/NEW2 domain-containing protein [Clostridia bacterium]|nr:NPCBM/NEW2 domain-containing protein [Clostridia bacterium]MBQ8429951.1 NPCBM/NEW2 domain-containing protein [Clostridia bacterium]